MLLKNNCGLYTDFYELTMAQGYFLNGRQKESACFDYFFRSNPFKGGYVVFAGISDLLSDLENYSFDKDDIEFLESQGFDKNFLNYLRDFKFSGNIFSVKEGEIVFPFEPVVTVEGNLIETQLIETILLNYLNFESLIATKASRIKLAAKDKIVADFGMRRAHGTGAVQASKAALIGGVMTTSNVYSGRKYNLPLTGTQAHSWIQSFENEITAFRKFTEIFKENTVLLVDTYDTLKSGVPNTIKVAKEFEKEGIKIKGIRLDSGDLAYLSKQARKMLNENGLNYVKILASNQLDEYLIRSLFEQGAPIDGFGVGTSLITGQKDAALDGVYKLSSINNEPTLKKSENIIKINFPGEKDTFRFINNDGYFEADGVCLKDENKFETIFHPHEKNKSYDVKDLQKESLLNKVMEEGKSILQAFDSNSVSGYRAKRIEKLPAELFRFENPHVYKVGISEKLMNLRDYLLKNIS